MLLIWDNKVKKSLDYNIDEDKVIDECWDKVIDESWDNVSDENRDNVMIRIGTMLLRFGTMYLMRVQTMSLRIGNIVDETWENVIE